MRRRGRFFVWDILTRAGCFVAIIALGHGLRRAGFFCKEDFHLLSKIVIKITLTAAIVSNFARQTIRPGMLLLAALGLGFGLLAVLTGYLCALRHGREAQAFAMLNGAGCNIGNFALPFAQSFLGPAGVVAVSLFDTGNSFICLGGAYGLAEMVRSGRGRFSLRPVLGALATSTPFLAYVTMTTLSLLRISLPGPVVEFAGIIADANAFLAMLMIGVGFDLGGDRRQWGAVARLLAARYALAACFAAVCYFVLPLPLEHRQALVLLALSPVASAAPAFTARMGGDFGLASVVNSCSILISIPLITAALIVLL